MAKETEEHQKDLLAEFRDEADFINKLYGLGDQDHATALDPGHVYESIRKYAEHYHQEKVRERTLTTFRLIGIARDGGTKHYVYGDESYFLDGRIGTKTRGSWYLGRPSKDSSNIVSDGAIIIMLNTRKAMLDKAQ